MRATRIVIESMRLWLPDLSQSLADKLLDVLHATLRAKNLTMTDLGRQLPGDATVKAKVKTLFRRMHAKRWQQQLLPLYRALAHLLLNDAKRPILLIDWTQQAGHALLACALVHDGRALPLFVEVHPLDCYGNLALEGAFLDTLKHHILPDCKPTVAVDAGFGSAFFDAVTAHGWDYLGRLQPQTLVQPDGVNADAWFNVDFLGEVTSSAPQDLGICKVAKTRPENRRVVRCKHPKGGHDRWPNRHRNPARDQYRRQAARGWVLATSLTAQEADATRVVALYALRMQIEELFRSIKNERDGEGHNASLTQSGAAHALLWQWGSINAVVKHLVGMIAEDQGWERHYATSTNKKRRVLSLMRLGALVLEHHDLRKITPRRMQAAISEITRRAEVTALAA